MDRELTGKVVVTTGPRARNVIDAVVRLAEGPEDKQIVGADGVVELVLANLVPPAAEKVGARLMHKTQMENPPPAADSVGAVCTPVAAGTGTSGGRR